jgi:hypothetical protein
MVFMGASKSDDVLGDTVGCGMLKCHARSPETDAEVEELLVTLVEEAESDLAK